MQMLLDLDLFQAQLIVSQANYRAWVLSELGTQTIPYAMSDQS
jgi:hypothetical protein